MASIGVFEWGFVSNSGSEIPSSCCKTCCSGTFSDSECCASDLDCADSEGFSEIFPDSAEDILDVRTGCQRRSKEGWHPVRMLEEDSSMGTVYCRALSRSSVYEIKFHNFKRARSAHIEVLI